MPGVLALTGGAEWTAGSEAVDRAILAACARPEVLVLTTAAAYSRPEQTLANATAWFASLEAQVTTTALLQRGDATNASVVERLRDAACIYFSGGSLHHLKSVLQATPAWAAIVEAWRGGAVLAGASAGAMVLGDPMVDPRGGAFTIGLGLIPGLAVLPHADTWSPTKVHRTLKMASASVTVVSIPERSAILWSSEGGWTALGPHPVEVHVGAKRAGLGDIPNPAIESS